MTNLFDPVRETLKQQGIIQRERTPIELVVYGVYLYAIGLSFRDVSRALAMIEEYVSHVAVWKWKEKLGKELGEKVFQYEVSDALVVDETKIQVHDKQVYLWAALCPETWKIAYLMLSYDRSNFNTYLFFKRLIALHGKPRLVITDGGPWYYWPLRRLGVRHEVVSGDVRNEVESLMAVIKDRTRIHDHYFPCKCKSMPEHVKNWFYLVVFYHNACFGAGRGRDFEKFTSSIKEVLSC